MAGGESVVDVETKQDFNDLWMRSMKSKIMGSSVPECFLDGPEIFIPRVGTNVRVGYEDYYSPKIVSIGPYHHGNGQLQAMQGYKAKSLKDLLDRNSTPLEKCIEAVRGKEAQARKCYKASMALSVCQFVEMMVVDAGFIIELFVKQSEDRLPARFFSIYPLIKRDMLLLENQLPFFILQCMFDLTITQKSPDLNEIAIEFLNSKGQRKAVLPPSDSVQHLLHLYQYQFGPDNAFLNPGPISSIPSATTLHAMGVVFKRASPWALPTDVKFEEDAVMKVPHLFITEDTIALCLNVITFEQYNIIIGTHITSFAVFMNYMIRGAEDVEFLCEKGIIVHRLPNHEDVVHIFKHMCSGVFIDPQFSSFSAVLRCIKRYSESPEATRRKIVWEARMVEKPWYYFFYKDKVTIALALLGGVGLWVFTCVQTVYAVLGYYH